MATKKKDPVLVPGDQWDKRRTRKLSCSVCKRWIVVSAFPLPEMGEGWPQHRCGHEVRPFDHAEVEAPAL